MRIGLPEIGLGSTVFLGTVGLIGGILFGIHYDWWMEILVVIGLALIVRYGGNDLELGMLAYVFPVVGFAIGCIIGDISWAFQSDTIVINSGEFSNPFLLE